MAERWIWFFEGSMGLSLFPARLRRKLSGKELAFKIFMCLHVAGTGNAVRVLLCPCCDVPHRAKPGHVHKVEIVLIRTGHNGNRMVARAKVLFLSDRACTPGGK